MVVLFKATGDYKTKVKAQLSSAYLIILFPTVLTHFSADVDLQTGTKTYTLLNTASSQPSINMFFPDIEVSRSKWPWISKSKYI